jgi:hypothetical protein
MATQIGVPWHGIAQGPCTLCLLEFAAEKIMPLAWRVIKSIGV